MDSNDENELANCLYGSALKRFIHAIVHYRRCFPSTSLLMTKFDLKSAYRRAHFLGVSALQSIATTVGLLHDENGDAEEITKGDLTLVSLRFTYGGAANPSKFSAISELIADLANIIVQHRAWKPLELFSEFISLTGDQPILEERNAAFAEARELQVDHELSEYGGVTEAFIEDIFTMFPFLSDDHYHRGHNAALLSIDTMGRPPTHSDDPLPRDPIVASYQKGDSRRDPNQKIGNLGLANRHPQNVDTATGQESGRLGRGTTGDTGTGRRRLACWRQAAGNYAGAEHQRSYNDTGGHASPPAPFPSQTWHGNDGYHFSTAANWRTTFSSRSSQSTNNTSSSEHLRSASVTTNG
jgi:hypothetical protein